MDDLNIVALVGRLTADPELRSTQGGTSVCSMRLAFNSSRKSQSGSWEDVPGFVNITVWGGQADSCTQHLSKGRRVAIHGRLQWREWEGEQGKRSALEVVAQRVQFLDGGKDSQPSTSSASPQGAPAQTPPINTNDVIPF